MLPCTPLTAASAHATKFPGPATRSLGGRLSQLDAVQCNPRLSFTHHAARVTIATTAK